MERLGELEALQTEKSAIHAKEKAVLEEEVDELLSSLNDKTAEVAAVRKEKGDEALRLNVLLRKQRMEISAAKSQGEEGGSEGRIVLEKEVSALKEELSQERERRESMEREKNMAVLELSDEMSRLKVS